MSDTTLIQRLRTAWTYCGVEQVLRFEAADALEQQAAEIAEKDAEIELHAGNCAELGSEVLRLQSEVEALRADAERLRLLLSDARSALDYHQEQTRPIHSTRTALAGIDAALRQEQPHG